MEIGVGEVGAGEVGVGEVGVREVGVREVGSTEFSHLKESASEVGVGEISTGEVSMFEDRHGEICSTEVSVAEIGVPKFSKICRVLFPPQVPNLNPLPQYFEMFWIRHSQSTPLLPPQNSASVKAKFPNTLSPYLHSQNRHPPHFLRTNLTGIPAQVFTPPLLV